MMSNICDIFYNELNPLERRDLEKFAEDLESSLIVIIGTGIIDKKWITNRQKYFKKRFKEVNKYMSEAAYEIDGAHHWFQEIIPDEMNEKEIVEIAMNALGYLNVDPIETDNEREQYELNKKINFPNLFLVF